MNSDFGESFLSLHWNEAKHIRFWKKSVKIQKFDSWIFCLNFFQVDENLFFWKDNVRPSSFKCKIIKRKYPSKPTQKTHKNCKQLSENTLTNSHYMYSIFSAHHSLKKEKQKEVSKLNLLLGSYIICSFIHIKHASTLICKIQKKKIFLISKNKKTF